MAIIVTKETARIEQPKESEKKKHTNLLNKLIQYKKNIKILNSLTDVEIAYVIKEAAFLQFQKDEIIIDEGDFDRKIYYILDGECRVIVNNIQVGIIKSHESVGELSPITKRARTATIIANKTTKAIAFTLAFDRIERKMKGFARLYNNIIDELFKKLDQANKSRVKN